MKTELWFESDEEHSPDAAAFLAALRAQAAEWPDADPYDSQVYPWEDDRLVLGFDVSDVHRNCVLRTLRVDYGRFGVYHGEDETGQFVSELTQAQHEYGTAPHRNKTPEELGQFAASWFRGQMIRPIEFCEWGAPHAGFNQYRLHDTGRPLCWSSANNEKPSNPGPPLRTLTVVTPGAPYYPD